MDKDQINNTETEDLDATTEALDKPEPIETDVHEDNQPVSEKVIVKRSGGFFSLFLALMALCLAAYTFYLQWQQPVNTNTDATALKTLTQQVQQLQTSMAANQSGITKNQNTQTNINQKISQLTAQLAELEQQQPLAATETQALPAFDNSANESAIEQLTQQITTLQNTIQTLQNQIANTNTPSNNSQLDLSSVDSEAIQKAAAVRALIQAQMWVDQHNINAAQSSLSQLLRVTSLNSTWKGKISALLNSLESATLPDHETLNQGLADLEHGINDLTLQTDAVATDAQWYDRFISVKKISDETAINSSAALVELKTALKRHLFEAKLYLNLQDQSGWQNSLNLLRSTLQESLPEQAGLIAATEALSGASVTVQIPSGFETHGLIAELKGQR